MDPYNNATAIILFVEMDDTLVDVTDVIEATTPRMFGVFYKAATNRLVILGDDDGRKEIPTFDDNVLVHIGNDFVPIINQVGDFDSTPNETLTANPMIDLSVSGPAGIRWPQGNGTGGQVLGIDAIVSELARDGVSSVNRHRLGWKTTPVNVCEVATVDLNVTTKSVLFTPNGAEEWVVDHVTVRSASTSLTTAQFSFGNNANADDWQAADLYDELTVAGKFTPVHPFPGATVTTNSAPFGLKCTVAQGAAATVVVEVWAYRIA